MVLQVLVIKYKRGGVKIALFGIVRDTSTNAVLDTGIVVAGPAFICFMNDKGRWARPHGGLTPSPSAEWAYRALFHCCGPAWQAQYQSFLDFSPSVDRCFEGRDHKNRRVQLELYAAVEFLTEEDLERYFRQHWEIVSRPKRKAVAIECD